MPLRKPRLGMNFNLFLKKLRLLRGYLAKKNPVFVPFRFCFSVYIHDSFCMLLFSLPDSSSPVSISRGPLGFLLLICSILLFFVHWNCLLLQTTDSISLWTYGRISITITMCMHWYYKSKKVNVTRHRSVNHKVPSLLIKKKMLFTPRYGNFHINLCTWNS